MTDHIPFITGADGAALAAEMYPDASGVRLPLEKAAKFQSACGKASRLWIDPCFDGFDDVHARRPTKERPNTWHDFMAECDWFEKTVASATHGKPTASDAEAFANWLLDACLKFKPAFITVPQLPMVDGSSRNKFNQAFARAAGKWKASRSYAGKFILPLVVTRHDQIGGKTARNPKVAQSKKLYTEAQANGYWVVDRSFSDEDGSVPLRNKRIAAVIAFHRELNEVLPASNRIAGPYWGLNVVLWAKGLVDHPAIGLGTGYQYFVSGSPAQTPSARVAIPSLRRRFSVNPRFRDWLDSSISELSPEHSAYKEFVEIKRNYTALSHSSTARRQVASFYKEWTRQLAAVPTAGRSMALFQDLSAAYALGKSLPSIDSEGTTRRPESVAEPLMLSSL